MEIVATSRLLWVFGGPGGICIIGTKTLIRGPSTRNSVIMGREHIKRTRPSVTDRQSHSTDLAEPFLEVVAGQGTRAYSGLRDVYDRNPYDKALVMRLCGSSAHKSRRQGRPHSWGGRVASAFRDVAPTPRRPSGTAITGQRSSLLTPLALRSASVAGQLPRRHHPFSLPRKILVTESVLNIYGVAIPV